MEKPSTMRRKILGSLPKAASPVTFKVSSPLSPVRVASRKGYPSPGISIIPQEARRKPKNSSFDQREPGSPKVSCMGQVKNRKNKKKNKGKRKPVLHLEEDIITPSSTKEVEDDKKQQPVLKMGSFKGGKECGRVDVAEDHKGKVVKRAASSSHRRKYGGNCGGVLGRFDWRTCERRGEEQVEKVIIPCPPRRDEGEMKLFKGEKQGDRADTNECHKPRFVERVPSLNQMKKYASSRGGMLQNFDCTIREVQAEKVIIPGSARRAADEIKIFKGSKEGDGFDVTDGYKSGCVETVPVPSLNQMKNYASSHGGVLNKFDWRICEGRGQEQVENVILPCSGRVVVGGEVEVAAEARKEVNAWKGRNKHPYPPHSWPFINYKK